MLAHDRARRSDCVGLFVRPAYDASQHTGLTEIPRAQRRGAYTSPIQLCAEQSARFTNSGGKSSCSSNGSSSIRIKSFLGTTVNAVETHVRVAISTYVLIAIVKKEIGLDNSLHEILCVLELNPLEPTPIPSLLAKIPELQNSNSQQVLF